MECSGKLHPGSLPLSDMPPDAYPPAHMHHHYCTHSHLRLLPPDIAGNMATVNDPVTTVVVLPVVV